MKARTFKIMTRHRSFEDGYESNQLVFRDAVLEVFPDIKVQLKQPDITVRIDVRRERQWWVWRPSKEGWDFQLVQVVARCWCYLAGLILSSRISCDERGVEIQCIALCKPTVSDPQALEKAKLLAAKIARFGGSIQFLTVPFQNSRGNQRVYRSVFNDNYGDFIASYYGSTENARALAIANGGISGASGFSNDR